MPIDTDAIRPRLQAALDGRYELGELLGAGGFAAVFRARDPFLERDVAIKVLDPALGLSADLEAQFLAEARTLAGVEHPHIVPLYSAEAHDGLLLLIMRLLPGESLSAYLTRYGALAPAEAARIAAEVAGALAAAHAAGVIHRDIKPDNILLDAAGHAMVTDFGIAQLTRQHASDTDGMASGTPRYMSPEQALAEPLDGRSDVYALGVVLYEMLTGQPLFASTSVTEAMAKTVAATPPRVQSVRREVPSALDELVAQLLVKDPRARPPAVEVAARLARARTPDALLSPQQARRKKWRRRLTFAGVGLGSAAVVVYFVVRTAIKLFVFMASGDAPKLLAMGDGLPDSLIAMARAEGLLSPTDTVRLAYIPAAGDTSVITFVTDSYFVRRDPVRPRRHLINDADLEIKTGQDSTGALSGFFIFTIPGQPPDTVYRGITGREMSALLLSLQSWSKERAVAESLRRLDSLPPRP